MLNMLIVEDNIYFSKLLINKLVQTNKNLRLCTIATDGKEALDIIKKESIDLILLDLNIPKCNGLEILDFLGKYKREEYMQSVIVVSGEVSMMKETIDNLLVYSCISKMQGLDEVVERVNEMCNEKENNLKTKELIIKKRKIIRKKINNELIELGYNIQYVGTGYISDSIYLLYYLNNVKKIKLEKDIYPIIAEKNNTTVNTVKCDIIRATSQLKKDVDNLKLKEYFGYFFDKGVKPKLVIKTVLNKVKQEL